MIEAIEHASPLQLAERKNFIAIRQRIAARAVPDNGIDLKREDQVVVIVETVAPEPIEQVQPPVISETNYITSVLRTDFPPRFLNHIQRRVGKKFEISVIDLVSHRRTAELVMPRHIAMYLCKILTPKSYPEIARNFDDRDHTVALYATRKITHLILVDETIHRHVSELREQLERDIAEWRMK